MDNFRINELILISGGYYNVGKIYVKHPTLREIIDYGEDNYYSSIAPFTNKPYDLKASIYESTGKLYIDIDEYDLFLNLFSNNLYGDHWKWIIGDYDFKFEFNQESQQIILFDEKRNVKIDKLIYTQISNFLRKINMMKQEHNPANRQTMKFLLEQDIKRNKRKNKKSEKEKSVLKSYISTIIWSKYGSYTYNNIWDLYIYQFFDGLNKISLNDNRDNILFGLYTGNIDTKKSPLDYKKLDLFK